ncbi:membrane protein YczE [Propioniciclava flava]
MSVLVSRPSGAPLLALTPGEQLRAGRLPRRMTQLMIGLILYGLSMAMQVRSTLGLDPWDVFHEGLTRRTGASFGTIVFLVGVGVLLLWIPLRQWPGLGTIANIVVIAVATDVSLALLTVPDSLAGRIALLIGGIILNGIAGGLYIGSQLGPGPRDGLMTGLVRRTGWSVRLTRTGIEVIVLASGFLLGGTLGLGTIVYALTIGPLVQFFLRVFTVDLRPVDAG